MILKKMYDYRFYPLVLLFGYLCLLGVDVYLLDYFSKGEITNILKKWIPWGLRVNFLLLVIAVAICYRDLLNLARQFLNKKGVLLAVLFVLAFSMTSFVVPRTHRIFYDEDIYANVGQNIALTNQTGYCNYGTFEYGEYFPHWISYNKEPSGWPFLISLAFQMLGTNEFYAFLLNNLFFALGALVAFFISWHLTGSYFTSYVAGLAFTLIPHNLIWSNTVAAEPSAVLFTGLIFLSLIVFLKTREDRHLFFASLMIPFACQMRPESLFVVPLAIVILLIISPGTLVRRKIWTFSLLTTLFLLPHILHFYAVSGHSWGAEGSKFSLEFLRNNLYANGIYYLNDRHFPVIITVLAALGLFCSRKLFKWRLLIICWFILFWGIFLFFYAGSYRYGADVRFALVSFMPLSILAGMGGGWIRDKLDAGVSGENNHRKVLVSCLVVFLMLFAFMKFVPLISRVCQEAWGSRYDHKYAEEFIGKIPERSIVLTQNPTMLLLWNQNAIQTYAGINNPGLIKDLLKRYQGHVYFHYNYWCNTKNKRNVRLCQSIRDKYDLEEVAKAKEQDYEYGLYRLSIVD
ncbi:MAG: glycosyltransferase family 39 protein [Deltaproteobacteria bacterium]|nr:glycosyltransferase family 39 protein [Deltaproteobacteria bacterium]